MKRYREPAIVFCIGSAAYSMIELIWRRYTHWTMALTGGICFMLLHDLFQQRSRSPLWQKCLLGAASITGVEFTVGCVVNVLLKWDVWDYSKMPGNLMGQICPLYSLLWSFLCIPAVGLSHFLHRKIARAIG